MKIESIPLFLSETARLRQTSLLFILHLILVSTRDYNAIV